MKGNTKKMAIQYTTWRSVRDFKTRPTVFCKSCEPKPKREKREGLTETDVFCALDCVASFEESA